MPLKPSRYYLRSIINDGFTINALNVRHIRFSRLAQNGVTRGESEQKCRLGVAITAAKLCCKSQLVIIDYTVFIVLIL